MVLASKMLAPNTMTLQNHKENLMVFDDSQLFDHWVRTLTFSTMGVQYEAESDPSDTNLSNTPGRSRVENLAAWVIPGSARSKCGKRRGREPHQSFQNWQVFLSKIRTKCLLREH